MSQQFYYIQYDSKSYKLVPIHNNKSKNKLFDIYDIIIISDEQRSGQHLNRCKV